MNIRNTLLAILLFCGIALPAFADSTVPPPDKYEKLWKRVDSMNSKGLYNSALKVVEQIYATAKQDKNPSQTVKALIHKLKFESYTGEDYMSNEIVILSKEVETAFFPLKPIFHSILADLYWRYYQANRYLFNNRTTTVNFVPDDLKTWDLRKIVEKVVWHYMASLQNADSLKATPINVYDDVLTVYSDSRKFRPTLYDFVAHRAIQFFASSEPGLTKPADRFEIDDPAVFGTASQFAALTFKTSDSLSLPFYALKIYQDLVRFHLNDKSPEALVDIEIARLHFLRAKSILEEKDSLYLQALINLEKTYAGNPVSTSITYEIANYYYAMGSKYYPGNPDETVRLAYKKAMEICDDAVKRFPESDGAYNCKYLQAMIKNREISLAFEGANISNKPFLSLVNYKNVPEITLRAIRTDPETWRKRSGKYYGENLVKLYLDEKATLEWTVKLPEDGDYQRHSSEIKIPVLPKGFYIILAATNKNFSMNGDAIALGNTWITDISFIHRTMEDGSIDMYVLDRDAGKSLAGVGADLWYEKYNYTTRQYDHVREGKYTSDEKGLIHIPPANDYRYFYIDFTKGDDRFVDYSFYQYKNYKYPPVKTVSTNFFTDRSIYRPGQTIYFKGIVLETEGEKTEIKTNYSTTVTLYDVNYQKVSDVTLTSNEYGTISGTFTAPTGVLNGNMQINNHHGSVYFSVEEYKRPKFEVTFDKVKGSYRLNETIKVKGNAKAYAGSNVDGAQVKYRVTRNARLPYWWYWWRGYNSAQADMEIANGTAKTDEKGEFNIEFKAKPDARYTKKYDPTFTYTIYADVTDINGETRSSSTYVAVSYKSLMVSVSVPNEIDKSDKVEPMAISSTNLGGEKEPSMGTIEIYKLKEPTRLLRSKYWDKPDRYLISKEDYIRDFPNDVYADEDNIYTWEKGDKAFSYNYDSKKDSVLILDKLSSYSEGSYKLIIRTKDKYGEDVESFSYFKVYSSEGNKMPVVSYNWSTMLKAIAEPGEKGSFLWGSSAKDVN
ncbi:MAG: MG2 domain-containing protein, partial [Bacteroidota bacterium]